MDNTDKILDNEWTHLLSATKTAKHPYHQFILSNSINNQPDSRIMILQNIDKKNRRIIFNTDNRSPKYSALINNNFVSVLFYDMVRKIQLRIKGIVILVPEPQRRISWNKMTLESKMCYLGDYAPSSILKEYKPNIPSKKITELNDEEYELGYTNFVKFDIKINSLDWLHLSSSGHRRIQYSWNENKIETNWIAS